MRLNEVVCWLCEEMRELWEEMSHCMEGNDKIVWRMLDWIGDRMMKIRNESVNDLKWNDKMG